MSQYTIGVDLGGTTMTAGLVNENHEIIGKITWATRLPRPAADLEKALADLCHAVAKRITSLFRRSAMWASVRRAV